MSGLLVAIVRIGRRHEARVVPGDGIGPKCVQVAARGDRERRPGDVAVRVRARGQVAVVAVHPVTVPRVAVICGDVRPERSDREAGVARVRARNPVRSGVVVAEHVQELRPRRVVGRGAAPTAVGHRAALGIERCPRIGRHVDRVAARPASPSGGAERIGHLIALVIGEHHDVVPVGGDPGTVVDRLETRQNWQRVLELDTRLSRACRSPARHRVFLELRVDEVEVHRIIKRDVALVAEVNLVERDRCQARQVGEVHAVRGDPQPGRRSHAVRGAGIERHRVAVILLVRGDEDVAEAVDRNAGLVAPARLEGRQSHRCAERDRRGAVREGRSQRARHQQDNKWPGS